MGNAMEEAKLFATHHTGSSDEGGVGMFLEKVYDFTYEAK